MLCVDQSGSDRTGKRPGRKFWGDLKHGKRHNMMGVTVVLGVVLLVLSPFFGVDGASFALEQQVAPRLNHHRQNLRPHHFQSGGSGGANENVMMNFEKFRSHNPPAGGGGDNEGEDLFEAAVLDDGDGDDIRTAAAASDPVSVVVEHNSGDKRLEEVELLLEKVESAKSVEEDDKEEEETTTLRQFKSLHHQHQHQRQQETKPSMTEGRTGRALWSSDFDKKASELCGTSASLDCGKRILSLIAGEQMTELSVHTKCDLRDDFLKCIDTKKRECLEEASKSVVPELPPKEVIKMEQSKLWKVLWTAGGCVLAD